MINAGARKHKTKYISHAVYGVIYDFGIPVKLKAVRSVSTASGAYLAASSGAPG